MKEIESHIVVAKLENPIRLSDYVGGRFTIIPSRKGMKKAIDNGLVTINGNAANTGDWLTGGERITLHEALLAAKPTIKLELEVLYEDEYLAVINKPSGIEVSGNRKRTIENALTSSLQKSTRQDGLSRPQPVHRLDFPTSGVLLIGKAVASVSALNKLFEARKVEKLYHAVAIGKMPTTGTVEATIDDKPALTHYRVSSTLESNKYLGLNLVELHPYTGRRHQLRKHLAGMGNPILGDKEYGIEGRIMVGNGLYLHASFLQFMHPISGEEIAVTSPLPKKFLKLFPNA